MNLNYAIFRSEPIMTINDLAQIGSHNKREKKAYNSNPDIDIEKSKDNIELVPLSDKYVKGFYNLVKDYRKEHEERMKIEREDRQKMIATYIDNIEISKEDNKLKINHYNFRKSFLTDLLTFNAEYNLPLNYSLFEDEYGIPIPQNNEVKTRDESKEYFNKLQSILGKEYKLNYYEIDTDDNLTNLKISSEMEVEKIIRLITLKDEKFDNGNLKLDVITVDLDNIKNNKIKELLEKVKNTFKKDEFCKCKIRFVYMHFLMK